MDLTRAVTYRGFLANDPDVQANIGANNGIITGSAIDTWDLDDVDVVQFMEKRSLQDGMDAGDVYLGGRRIRLAGTLYAASRNLLLDNYFTMRAALNPVLAQADSPADRGYQSLAFAVPTSRQDDFPDLVIPMQVYAMPFQFHAPWNNNAQGGVDADPLAIPWSAVLRCKDPGIYGLDPQDYDLSAGGTVSGNLVNRGTYNSRLNMLIVVGSAAGSISVTAGGSTFTITVPASTGNRTIRYKGNDKLLTVEENSVEVLRMDLLPGVASMTHPSIPVGTSAYSVSFTGVTPQVGSHAWFWEQYA